MHTHKFMAKLRRPTLRAGMTLIEVTIGMVIVATILMASAGAFTRSLNATDQARRTTRAAIFLETAMEDISAQDYRNLLVLNGNQIFDRTDASDSDYSIALTVFLVEIDLLQIQAVVTDVRTNDVMGRLSMLRSRR